MISVQTYSFNQVIEFEFNNPKVSSQFTPKVLFGSLPRPTGENQEKETGHDPFQHFLYFSCFWTFVAQGRVIFTSINQDRTQKNVGKYLNTVDGEKNLHQLRLVVFNPPDKVLSLINIPG